MNLERWAHKKLIKLFLFKGKTILHKLSVRRPPAYFFLQVLRFQWKPKHKMEILVVFSPLIYALLRLRSGRFAGALERSGTL